MEKEILRPLRHALFAGVCWRGVALAPDDDNGTGAADDDAGKTGGDDTATGKETAEQIAARAGGAFNKKPVAKEGSDGDKNGDDGVDPATKPKGKNEAHTRPDHVPEKFYDPKTGEIRADDLAKSYKALEGNYARLKNDKGVSGDVGDKPEDYKFEVPDDAKAKMDRIRDLDVENDPAVKVFQNIAHKHKLPKAVASGILIDFLTELNPSLPVPKSEDDILKELGDGGVALRDGLGTWMQGKYASGEWSADELADAFTYFGSSGSRMRFLAKLRADTGEIPIPMGQPVGDGLPSEEEWYAMNKDPRMATDLAYRTKVEKLGEQIFGDDPAGSSRPGVGVSASRGFERREGRSTRT